MKQQIEDVAARHYEAAIAFGVTYESFKGAITDGVGLGMDKADKRLEQLLMSLQATLMSIESCDLYGEYDATLSYIHMAQEEVEEALSIIRLEEW